MTTNPKPASPAVDELPPLDAEYEREMAEVRSFSTMPNGPLELRLRSESRERQLHQALSQLSERDKEMEILRRRIHLIEEHNQFFERCESLYCNPQGTSTYGPANRSEREWLAIPPGDPAKLARIADIEAQLAQAKKEIEELKGALWYSCEGEENPETAYQNRIDGGKRRKTERIEINKMIEEVKQ